MKFLFWRFPSANHYITMGWMSALQEMGYDSQIWPEGTPAFDIFDIIEPDVFVGTTYDLDRATIKCILERPNMKVALKSNNWGPIDEKIDLDKFPIGISTENERRKVLDLVEKAGNRVLLFNWYHPNRMEETMGFWDEAGVPTIGLQPAADTTKYRESLPKEELECDLGFIGGYWGYKGQNIKKYLIPLRFR